VRPDRSDDASIACDDGLSEPSGMPKLQEGRRFAMSTTDASVKPDSATKPDPAAKAPQPKSSRKTKPGKDAEQRLRKVRGASILLKQVSDPTRLQVILLLADGERHVGALCQEMSQSQPAVSHHLALLRHGGIISPRRQGKNNFYSLTETGRELAGVLKSIIS
jgi:DNA-binding transcriptional ArsR family regulator